MYKESIPEPFEKRRINEIRSNAAQRVERAYKSAVPTPVTVRENTDSFGQENRSSIVRESTSAQVQGKTGQTTSSGVKIIPVGETPVMGLNQFPKSETTQAVLEQKKETDLNGGSDCQNEISTLQKNVSEGQDTNTSPVEAPEQMTLESMSPDFLTRDAKKMHRIIGQLFKTYWLIEYEDKLYIIDQHAAHEKVLYERTMARLHEKEYTSQAISPPIVLSLDAKEQEMLERYRKDIERLGYEIENFGGREYMISAVPDNLFSIDMKDLFIEMLDDFSNLTGRETPDLIMEKVASMSCKAAVKGNDALSLPEIDALIEELLTLDNPFNCPHGRPTIIAMSKYEIEKKFKRIV